MKKTIRIFVAGAKALKTERNALKALAHDLNTNYQERQINLDIKIRSYEDFKDSQDEYNKYIVSKADIVVFILKDKIGPKTEEEFVKAASAFGIKQRPEIIIFLNKDRKETPEIAHIQDLVQKHLGDHYFVDYQDDEDLKVQARKRIDRHVRPTFKMSHNATRRLLAFTALCAVIFAGLFVWSYLFHHSTKANALVTNEEEQSLLFVGGGSVVNYINDVTGIDIRKYENSIFASMPSGTAWPQIAEEYNRFINSKGETPRLPFRTIVISANKADEQIMLKSCRKDIFTDNASIAECYLGDDSLQVLLSKRFIEKYANLIGIDTNNKDLKIKVSDLKKIIKSFYDDRSVKVFATSETSGTRIAFNEHIFNNDKQDILELKGDTIITYNEADNTKNFERDSIPYILLGSTHYYPKCLTDSMVKNFILTDEDGNPIKKSFYLYFVVFKDEDYQIPDPIFNFIKLLNLKNPEKIKLNNNLKDDRGVIAGGLLVPLYN